MWIKRELVLDYFKLNFSKDMSLENIKESCKSLSVYISPKLIEQWLLKKAKENGIDISKAKDSFRVKSVKDVDDSLIEKMMRSLHEQIKLEAFRFRRIDYVYLYETLKIYTNKCLQLCEILEKLAGKIHLDNKTYEFFDFTIKDDKVFISDVERVAKPLMKIYEYALATYVKANNPSTYLTKIIQPGVTYDSMLPSKELLLDSILNPDEFIALTNKQKHDKFQKDL